MIGCEAKATIGACCALLAAGTAGAQSAPQGSVAVIPNVAGKPSRLAVDASPGDAGSSGEQARSAAVLIARGFRIDPRSRARRCSRDQAERFECPAASRIGRGQADGTASLGPAASQSFSADIDLFLAPAQRRGDIAGVVVQVREPQSGFRATGTGRLIRLASGRYGSELRFDQLAGGQQLPPGVTVTVQRIRLSVSASRTVRKVVRRRHRRRVRRVRYHLIRNPRTCSGSWPYEVRVSYASGERAFQGSIACRRR